MTRRTFSLGALAAVGTLPFSLRGATRRAALRLKLGVISDIHVPSRERSNWFRAALRTFDAERVDGVVIAGDLGFNGVFAELKVVADVWNEAFPTGRRSDGEPVERLFITGNHDVDGWFYHRPEWPKVNATPDPATVTESYVFNRAKMWPELFGEPFAPVILKEVKGYTFVLNHWHSRMLKEKDPLPDFFRAHGRELAGEKPFFFVQHNHPQGTCYAGLTDGVIEGWGTDDAGLATPWLAAFPNCIAFSGHSHFTLTDERSIWQGAFTSIGSSACPSGAMAGALPGRDNFGWSGDREAVGCVDTDLPKQGMIVEVCDDEIVIRRRDFRLGAALGPDWVLPWPIARGRPYAIESRRATCPPPRFPTDVRPCVTERKTEKGAWLDVTFPPLHGSASAARALDFSVRLEVRTADVARVAQEKRVYSVGALLPEGQDVAVNRCAFARSLVPFRWQARAVVTPYNTFGTPGAPIASNWTRYDPLV